MTANSLIDQCLNDIGRGYPKGLLPWLKQHPGRWRELLALEFKINEAVLSKRDEAVLRDALSDYREFFMGMAEAYGNLSQGRGRGKNEDGIQTRRTGGS